MSASELARARRVVVGDARSSVSYRQLTRVGYGLALNFFLRVRCQVLLEKGLESQKQRRGEKTIRPTAAKINR